MLLGSLLAFALFFATAVVVGVIFLFLYAKVTPYDDYRLIFEKSNTAAAIGFGGAIAGLCIPLYSALTSSVSYLDFVIWAAVAMLIQLIFAFFMTRGKGKYSVARLIDEGVVSAGVLLAFISISIGLLNAGSMSY
jgi:putative membrane protein